MEKADIRVLIAAYGPDALERIASLPHPRAQGVAYFVSWQCHQDTPVSRSLAEREDFMIFREESVGLCNNRNALLKYAGDGIALISDDDLAYASDHFENVRKAFGDNPECHILAFRYASQDYPKRYPGKGFDLKKPEKGYFVTSMEIALNAGLIKREFGSMKTVEFHPAFGVNGTLFGSGEEDILICRLLRRGFKGRYIPAEICVNTESTTSERTGDTEGFIQTKGAVMTYISPLTWPLRMLTHAFRSDLPLLKYCRWWLAGVRKAHKNGVFRCY